MDESTPEQSAILAALDALPDDDARLEVIRDFCVHCGMHDNGCQCWNDE